MLIFGVPIYAVMANICYTAGPIVDYVNFIGKPRARLFIAGFVFSVVLTALPGVWAVWAWIITLVTGHKL
jgi:hypothetical protein